MSTLNRKRLNYLYELLNTTVDESRKLVIQAEIQRIKLEDEIDYFNKYSKHKEDIYHDDKGL